MRPRGAGARAVGGETWCRLARRSYCGPIGEGETWPCRGKRTGEAPGFADARRHLSTRRAGASSAFTATRRSGAFEVFRRRLDAPWRRRRGERTPGWLAGAAHPEGGIYWACTTGRRGAPRPRGPGELPCSLHRHLPPLDLCRRCRNIWGGRTPQLSRRDVRGREITIAALNRPGWLASGEPCFVLFVGDAQDDLRDGPVVLRGREEHENYHRPVCKGLYSWHAWRPVIRVTRRATRAR